MRFTPEQAERLGLVRTASGDWTQERKGNPTLSPASGAKARAVELEAERRTLVARPEEMGGEGVS